MSNTSNLPNIPPQIFTLSATAIGYLLVEQLNQTEQDAIGNWFQLIGQILETNSSYPIQNNTNNNSNNQENNSNNTGAAIAALNKTLNAIKEELENLKKYNL